MVLYSFCWLLTMSWVDKHYRTSIADAILFFTCLIVLPIIGLSGLICEALKLNKKYFR